MSEIPTEETTAVDPHVQLLLDNLISIIRGGKTPEQAASSLRAVARDPETVDRALEEYWAEVGRHAFSTRRSKPARGRASGIQDPGQMIGAGQL